MPLAASLFAALALGGYALHVASYWHQVNDDAFITFRYNKNLTLGRGPYFNSGEHVEGYTNFSLMLFSAGVIAVLGDDAALPAAKWINALAGVAALIAVWHLGRSVARRIQGMAPAASALGWQSAAFVAGSSSFVLNTTTGLETTLFASAIVVGLALAHAGWEHGRWYGAGFAFAFAALTRPEGAAVFGVAFAARLLIGECRNRAGRRALAFDAAVVGVAVAGHLAFRMWAYDGELVPNTYYAKQGGLQNDRADYYILRFVIQDLMVVLWVVALLPLALGGGRHTESADETTSRSGPQGAGLRRAVLPAFAVACFSIGAVFLTGPDWMLGNRILAPYVPLWGVLVVTGVAAACRSLPRGATVALVCSALLVGGSSAWNELRAAPVLRHWVATRAAGYAHGHAALAAHLRETCAPGATVGLMDVGIVGYRCIDLRILDTSGLTDRFIAKSPGPFLEKRYDPRYVFDQRPAVLVVAGQAPFLPDGRPDFDRLTPFTLFEAQLTQHPLFRQHYARVRPHVSPDVLERVAEFVGAERAFWHDYPDRAYLLLAYRRGGEP
jgi:hypothetical protein